jgi:hypothetical protein
VIDDILSVGKALFDLQKELRKADHERRKQIAEYFSSISECLAGISKDLESGKVARAKCAELEIYARDLPVTIQDQVPAERVRELAGQLAIATIAPRAAGATVADDLASDDMRADNIAKLDESSGVFKALANSIRATPSTTKLPPIPRYVWLLILCATIVAGIYAARRLLHPAPALRSLPSPDTSAPLTDLTYSFSMEIKCNMLDLNSFCQRAKRIFVDYEGEVDKAGGASIRDQRMLIKVGDILIMTPRSPLWSILLAGRPPIYFLYIDIFQNPADADKYITGDLTITPNISWIFAASNREDEHNLIFLKYDISKSELFADYSASPINLSSDGTVSTFQGLSGTVMLLFVRDGQATDAVPQSFGIKDKQGRMIPIMGPEFQVKKGYDHGKAVTYYKYTFPS